MTDLVRRNIIEADYPQMLMDEYRRKLDDGEQVADVESHPRTNKHAAAFVLYQSVRATLLAAILEEPVGLSDAILVDEVSDMVSAHLSISGLG